ncbi:unnamed protein product [Mycena citricolor]|uniref:Meiotically up-regulated protein Msb1/Mug8 domain-containing protein n=1 Tax=Mycena citricolor TaxID=2018698 RepID=A0AAD2HNN8_9AGAR|nr:unnamed protein product [Mycena citricolor]
MPSLFSRARTASTPSKIKAQTNYNQTVPSSSSPLSPVDDFGAYHANTGEPGSGAVGFLPTSVPTDLHTPWPNTAAPNAAAGATPGLLGGSAPRAAYGFLSPGRDAVLSLADVARLSATLCAALDKSGVTTPFVFSALALDVRRSAVARLVGAFLKTCGDAPSRAAEDDWQDEARFAGPHELGMALRWGLSRVVRVEDGRELRGLLSWAWYERWKSEEAVNSYPPTAFSTLLASLPAQLQPILQPLFAICIRLVAHSAQSGHTPPSLATILSPLLFGLCVPQVGLVPSGVSSPRKDSKSGDSKNDPEALLFPTTEDFASFPSTYGEYLRGARAAEHMLLAAIREEVTDHQGALNGPTRLREWVGMYPQGIVDDAATTNGKSRPNPRRGARTVRIVHVRRNVRSYSADLVRGASSWASSSASSGSGPNDWASSKAWRNILAGAQGTPRYSDTYRRRLDLAVGVHPQTASMTSMTSDVPSLSSSIGSSPYSSSAYTPSNTSLASDTDGGAFRSLTDLKWGEFESLGFSHGTGAGLVATPSRKEPGIDGRLKFDLTENARAERAAKRETLSWNDFSSAGFSRSDAPLSATLQFSTPLSLNLTSPATPNAASTNNAELTKKLRKAHKALPAFGWDTAPVIGAEEVIEEAFMDIFCDLLWGGGWMERSSGVAGPQADLARECQWALIEFKSRSGGAQDPGCTVVLFEEFVPREYRLALAGIAPPGTRRRLPSLFSPAAPRGGGKTWKQASTLNGRPYVLGATPTATGSTRDLGDFDSMLRAQGGQTKLMTLAGSGVPKRETVTTTMTVPPRSESLPTTPLREDNSSTESGGDALSKSQRRQSGSRFRIPGGIIPGPSPGGLVRPGMIPAEYAAVEFETRLAEAGGDNKKRGDEWVDILVGSMQDRRMDGQDAELRVKKRGWDQELASMEVAQALAAETMGREMSPPISLRPDSDVSEIERVPRQVEEDDEDEDVPIPYDEDDDEQQTPLASTHPDLAARLEAARQNHRQGASYFDLHPDRRPPSVATGNEDEDEDEVDDDPRSLLSGNDSSEDVHDIPRNLDAIRPLPTKPSPVTPISPVDIPPFDDSENLRRAERIASTHSKTDSAVLSPAMEEVEDVPTPVTIAAPQPSKTSALIDMFREREQRALPPKPSGPAPPSRLPVRAPAKEASPGLPVSPKPEVAAPPPQKASPPLLEATTPDLEDAGRASPGRYVHGAPLHNVMEEEEEE